MSIELLIPTALSRTYSTGILLIPEDRGAGRVDELVNGNAGYAILGDEYIHSFDASYEFATKW